MLVLSLSLTWAQDFHQLRAPEASASSFLQSNWNKYTENYHANYLLDGNPRTAWVEGAKGTGQNEWIAWSVSPVAKVDKVKLRLRNGYQKSDALLTANAAPAVLGVSWMANGRVVHESDWTVARKMGWQEIVLDPPTDKRFDGVRLTVKKVHEGRTYADLCISDAEVWVASETPFQAPVENAKHQALLAWIAERQATADYFAAQPKQYPFAATSFEQNETELTSADAQPVRARIAKLQTELGQMPVLAPEVWRVEVKDVPKEPDGIGELQTELMRWFANDRTYFEAESEWRSSKKGVDEWHREHREANARLRKRDDGTVSAATYGVYDVYEERGVYTYDRRFYLLFDEGERLTSLYSRWDSGGDGCETDWTARVWDISRDTDGRVNGLTMFQEYGCTQPWEGGEDSVSVTRTVFSPTGS